MCNFIHTDFVALTSVSSSPPPHLSCFMCNFKLGNTSPPPSNHICNSKPNTPVTKCQ